MLNRLAGLDDFKSSLSAAEPAIAQEWNDNKKIIQRWRLSLQVVDDAGVEREGYYPEAALELAPEVGVGVMVASRGKNRGW